MRKTISLKTMRYYTVNEAIKLLKNPKNQEKITQARYYERELRLYTESQTEKELSTDEAFKNLCAIIKKRLPDKSFVRVLDFFEFPLAAVELTNGILVELYKVFNAKNTFFSHEIDTEQKNKQIKEIVKGLDVYQYIVDTGKKVLKNKPNTIVVIDKNENGIPYIVTVDNDRLIDAEICEDGSLKYIAFKHSDVEGEPNKTRIAFYDSEEYKVFVFDKDKQTYTLDREPVKHGIGYCPAKCFMNSQLNSLNPFKRLIPIAIPLGRIRSWQLFTTYEYYSEHYAPFPIIEKVKSSCSEVNCVSGTIPNPKGAFFVDGERKELDRIACPVCSKSENIGVGTVINLKPKKNKDDENGAGLFKFIAPEITGLEYIASKLEKLEKYIELKSIGQNNVITTEAVNEIQVKGSFQSKETVLLNLKEVFEELYIWIVQTSAKAYFLGNVEITVYANFGSEFYLVSESELQGRFEKAKAIGMPESEVNSIYDRLITTKYKDNPDMILKMELLKILDPAPFATFEEVDKMKESGVLTTEEYIIKRRFMKFIERFEMENAPLIIFGKNLSLSQKINNIFNILKKYANEYNKTEPI